MLAHQRLCAACLPSARSASIRSSSAAKRSSPSRAASACANGAYAKSASGGPRHSVNASRSRSLDRRASPLPSAVRPASTSASKRSTSSCPRAVCNRYPCPRVTRTPSPSAPGADSTRTPARSWPRSPADACPTAHRPAGRSRPPRRDAITRSPAAPAAWDRRAPADGRARRPPRAQGSETQAQAVSPAANATTVQGARNRLAVRPFAVLQPFPAAPTPPKRTVACRSDRTGRPATVGGTRHAPQPTQQDGTRGHARARRDLRASSLSAGAQARWVARPNPDQQAAQIARAAATRPAQNTWLVRRPNPDQQAAALAQAAATRPAKNTWVVRPNPDEQYPLPGPVTIVHVTDPSRGFDWGDAGIGAAGTLGLILAATGGTLLIARRRNHPNTPTGPRTAS